MFTGRNGPRKTQHSLALKNELLGRTDDFQTPEGSRHRRPRPKHTTVVHVLLGSALHEEPPPGARATSVAQGTPAKLSAG